ncbi:MAG: DUF61 family protein [Methanobacterium sp.]|nr:DUF61 family protein [Methanobacterium sp.]
MTHNSDRSDRLLKKQIFNLNRHLPRQRKNLSELLVEDKPHVIGADGTRHRFKRNELQILSQIIPVKEHNRLKLPIYLEIESQTSGTRVNGELELKILCSVLGLEDCGNEMYIYRPDLRIIRRELPTTTQYIFLVR